MLKISYACYPGLSTVISVQLVTKDNREKKTLNINFVSTFLDLKVV